MADEVKWREELLRTQRRRNHDEIEQHGIANSVDSCRFDEAAIASMASLYSGEGSRRLSARDVRQARFEAPAAPPVDAQELLLRTQDNLRFHSPKCPWWQANISGSRERFSGVAIQDAPFRADGTAYYRLFSMQRPVLGVLSSRGVGQGRRLDRPNIGGQGPAPPELPGVLLHVADLLPLL